MFILLMVSAGQSVLSAAAQSADSPRSQYCQDLKNLINKQWHNQATFENPQAVTVSLESSGAIKQIKAASADALVLYKKQPSLSLAAKPADPGSLKSACKFLEGLTNLPAPPGGRPGDLTVVLANKEAERTVSFSDAQLRAWAETASGTVSRNWFPVKCAMYTGPKIQFTVSSNGTRSNVCIKTKSESNIADKDALKAIDGAKPLPPLPEGVAQTMSLLMNFQPTNQPPCP